MIDAEHCVRYTKNIYLKACTIATTITTTNITTTINTTTTITTTIIITTTITTITITITNTVTTITITTTITNTVTTITITTTITNTITNTITTITITTTIITTTATTTISVTTTTTTTSTTIIIIITITTAIITTTITTFTELLIFLDNWKRPCLSSSAHKKCNADLYHLATCHSNIMVPTTQTLSQIKWQEMIGHLKQHFMTTSPFTYVIQYFVKCCIKSWWTCISFSLKCYFGRLLDFIW